MSARWGSAARRTVSVSIEGLPHHFAAPPLARIDEQQNRTVAGVHQPVGRTARAQPTKHIPGPSALALPSRCREHTVGPPAATSISGSALQRTLLPLPRGKVPPRANHRSIGARAIRRRNGNVLSGRRLDRHVVLRINLARGRIQLMMLDAEVRAGEPAVGSWAITGRHAITVHDPEGPAEEHASRSAASVRSGGSSEASVVGAVLLWRAARPSSESDLPDGGCRREYLRGTRTSRPDTRNADSR